jgi:hypothetical protein
MMDYKPMTVLEMATMTVQACLLPVLTQGLQTNDSAESAGNGTNDSPGMPAVSTRDGRQTNDSAECWKWNQ